MPDVYPKQNQAEERREQNGGLDEIGLSHVRSFSDDNQDYASAA